MSADHPGYRPSPGAPETASHRTLPGARLLVWVLVWICAAPVGALAQAFSVLTGEHAGFTRIVVMSAARFDWAMTPDGERRVLSLPASAGRIDLSRAFARIPRSRLSDMRQVAAGLELDLACPCQVRTWQDRPGLVIIDISDPAPDQPPETGEPLAGPAPVAWTPDDAARNAGTALARTFPGSLHALGLSTEPSQAPSGSGADLLHRQLARALADSLSQGVLAPAPVHSTPPRQLVPPPDDAALSAAMVELPPNLRLSGALDRDRDRDGPDGEPSLSDAACHDAGVLDRALTADDGHFMDARARLGETLYAEFDRPDPLAFVALAGLYLRHGMGAEARGFLAMSGLSGAEIDLLIGLADTLDGTASNSRHRLALTLACGGNATALAAAAGVSADAILPHAPAIALGFGALPPGVRAALGPDLARRLIDAGAPESARILTDILRNTSPDLSRDVALLDARLTALRSGPQPALVQLDRGPQTDTDGMLLRLRLLLDSGGTVDSATLAQAEATATALRATDLGRDLMAEVVRAHARSPEPQVALPMLDRLTGWTPGGSMASTLLADLRTEAWTGLATQATDRAFLTAVLGRSDWLDPDLPSETRIALAERLLGFGLTDHARNLLTRPANTDERLTRARIDLAAGDPAAALDQLQGLDSPAALHLRATALEATGAPGAALQIYQQTGATADADRAALAAGEWAALSGTGAAPPDAQAATTTPTAPQDPDTASAVGAARPTGLADGTQPGTRTSAAAPATALGTLARLFAEAPVGGAPVGGAPAGRAGTDGGRATTDDTPAPGTAPGATVGPAVIGPQTPVAQVTPALPPIGGQQTGPVAALAPQPAAAQPNTLPTALPTALPTGPAAVQAGAPAIALADGPALPPVQTVGLGQPSAALRPGATGLPPVSPAPEAPTAQPEIGPLGRAGALLRQSEDLRTDISGWLNTR